MFGCCKTHDFSVRKEICDICACSDIPLAILLKENISLLLLLTLDKNPIGNSSHAAIPVVVPSVE